jgi:hypothetical protein
MESVKDVIVHRLDAQLIQKSCLLLEGVGEGEVKRFSDGNKINS